MSDMKRVKEFIGAFIDWAEKEACQGREALYQIVFSSEGLPIDCIVHSKDEIDFHLLSDEAFSAVILNNGFDHSYVSDMLKEIAPIETLNKIRTNYLVPLNGYEYNLSSLPSGDTGFYFTAKINQG